MPIGAILALVVIVVRAINAAQNKDSTSNSSAAAAVPVSRGSATFWQDGGAGVTIVLQLILFAVMSGFYAAAFETHAWGFFAIASGAAYLLFPAWLARSVFAPLGLVRLASFTATLSRVEWRRDKPGGPALIAAWALAQQDKPSPDTIAWVETRLTSSKRALQGSGVAAYGLLEAAKGRHESAREWLDSVLFFDPRVAPVQVRVLAAEWLSTDAAARGDWKRVREIAESRKWPRSGTLTLLGALAGRALGERLPTNLGLWWWWLFAPRKPWTFAFVRAAVARAPVAASTEALPQPPGSLDALGQATFLTVALQRTPAPPAPAVVAVARAWETALDADTRTKLFARATLIGGGEPDDAVREVRELIERALAPLLPATLTGLGELPALLESASLGRKDVAYRELEDRMSRMESRKIDQRELPQLEEWREYMALRKLYLECSGSGADRSLAHSVIRDKLVNFAVWLYNVRLEKPLANAMFRLLEAEAVALGDTESERLNKKNAGCDL